MPTIMGTVMFALMLFMFFFFFGFAVMFYYLLRRLDTQARFLSDEHAQMRVLLRAMESRLDKMSQGGDQRQTPKREEDNGESGADPLLRLSFEEPQTAEGKGQIDPALELNLEAAPSEKRLN